MVAGSRAHGARRRFGLRAADLARPPAVAPRSFSLDVSLKLSNVGAGAAAQQRVRMPPVVRASTRRQTGAEGTTVEDNSSDEDYVAETESLSGAHRVTCD